LTFGSRTRDGLPAVGPGVYHAATSEDKALTLEQRCAWRA